MATFKPVIDVPAGRVSGICQVKNVVDGVVIACSMRLARALAGARYLLARLRGCLGVGLATLAGAQAGPAALARMWAPQPVWSAGAHTRRHRRLGRPRPASSLTRF